MNAKEFAHHIGTYHVAINTYTSALGTTKGDRIKQYLDSFGFYYGASGVARMAYFKEDVFQALITIVIIKQGRGLQFCLYEERVTKHIASGVYSRGFPDVSHSAIVTSWRHYVGEIVHLPERFNLYPLLLAECTLGEPPKVET